MEGRDGESLRVMCRAEEIKALLEGNVKGMKKEAGQQLRELQVQS